MSEIIILLFFLFLAVFGVSNLMARLWLFIVKPRKREKTYTVSYLTETEAEDNFLFAFEKYRWYGKEYCDYLIFVCDKKPSQKLQAFAKTYNNIFFCKDGGVEETIKKINGG